LSKKGHLYFKKNGDHEWHMIDGTIIRAHRHAAGTRGGKEPQELGRSCGGFSSKIHAKVDALGMPLGFIIKPGQSSDIGQAEVLVGEEWFQSLLADKRYDSNTFREFLQNREIVSIVPGKKNRIESIVYDAHIYKERNAVERFFGRIKEYRRIATRFDKTVVMFRAGLVLASILMWINFRDRA
jgi:transposase